LEADPLLTEIAIFPDSPRCGRSGLISLSQEDDLMIGERNII
jgi:hypothetical protein